MQGNIVLLSKRAQFGYWIDDTVWEVRGTPYQLQRSWSQLRSRLPSDHNGLTRMVFELIARATRLRLTFREIGSTGM